jgi:hypothetical protein
VLRSWEWRDANYSTHGDLLINDQDRGRQSTGEEFNYFSRTQLVQASFADVTTSALKSRNELEGSKILPDSAIVRLRTTGFDLAADASSLFGLEQQALRVYAWCN